MPQPETTTSLAVEREIVNIARRLLDGEYPLFEACHRIAALRWRLPNPDDPLFDTFVAIACETEDLPLGDQRQYWDSPALKRKDDEAAAYAKKVRSAAEEAAEKTVSRYSFVDQPAGSSK
jgi:hypothetical protein